MSRPNVEIVSKCRVCKKPGIKKFLYLGTMPMVNNFLTAYQLDKPEFKFPLTVCYCKNCGMVQLAEVVNPKIMYQNYVYISSFSTTMNKHFLELSKSLVKKLKLGKNSLVLEMGSNDGTLLKHFKNQGVKVLGVDPAKNLAKIANSSGIETLDTFFGKELANKIVKNKGKASLVIGTNVFAHIHDLDDVLLGLQSILSRDGIFVAEFPYLVDLIENVQFDTIYHEHLSYFSLKPLKHLFNRFDLELYDVKRIPVHGGSIRIFVRRKTKNGKISKSLQTLLGQEERKGINNIEVMSKFTDQVNSIKKDLTTLLSKLSSQGKRVVGFGAPAKGNILLNYCGIDSKLLSYVTDNIPYKQGLYTPGTHIQVLPENKIFEDRPDYVLLLPWNFKEEILKKLSEYRRSGGKVIIPIPKVIVL